jgi:hypothetical protein
VFFFLFLKSKNPRCLLASKLISLQQLKHSYCRFHLHRDYNVLGRSITPFLGQAVASVPTTNAVRRGVILRMEFLQCGTVEIDFLSFRKAIISAVVPDAIWFVNKQPTLERTIFGLYKDHWDWQ